MESTDLLVARARTLYLHRSYRSALRIVERALQGAPDDFDALALKGGILNALSRPKAEMKCNERLIKLHPSRPHGFFNQANLLHGIGNLRNAVRLYSKALRVLGKEDIDLGEVLFHGYADALRNLGRPKAALAMIRMALAHPSIDASAKLETLIDLKRQILAEVPAPAIRPTRKSARSMSGSGRKARRCTRKQK